jgi:peptide-methionine (S)-S-oxide reductase
MLRPSTATPLLACLLAFGCSHPSPGAGQTAAPAAPAAAPLQTATTTDPMAPTDPTPATRPSATTTLGAGCFWCIEAVLDRIDGVVAVESGYMGGSVPRPTYDAVCSGTTGHAEVVQVTFDPQVLSYEALLGWFFKLHDPTTLNRQGNDVGTQYRSAIFVHDDEQRRTAQVVIERERAHFRAPIVTEVTAASTFWPAEAYHQDYFANNPRNGYCRAVIPPKLEKLGLDRVPPKAK